MSALKPLIFSSLLTLLAGCDQLGIETPDKVAARAEAEGKAIGGACRHSGRALEECYEMNRRASKAAVYAGWRDMDGYMRENNIAVVKPVAAEDDEAAPKPSAKAETKVAEDEKKPVAAEAAKPDEAKPVETKPSPSAAPADKSPKPSLKSS